MGRGFRSMSQAFRRGPGYRVRRLDVRFSACRRRRPDTEHREPILGTGYRKTRAPGYAGSSDSDSEDKRLPASHPCATANRGAESHQSTRWRGRRDNEESCKIREGNRVAVRVRDPAASPNPSITPYGLSPSLWERSSARATNAWGARITMRVRPASSRPSRSHRLSVRLTV